MDLQAALTDRVARKAVHLVPQPQSAVRLRQLLAKPHHGLPEVVGAVMLDPLLAAAVMRIANSVTYARGGSTSSLTAAVQRVGEKELARLSLAAGLGVAASAAGPLLALRRRVMQSALTSAVICERVAPLFHHDPEALFLAGLLHDVGLLVALGTLELIVAQSPGIAPRSAEDWLALADRHHVALGGLLGEKWALPDDVRRVIAHHHEPSAGGEGLLAIVELSDALTLLLERGEPASQLAWLDRLSAARREEVLARLAPIPSLVAALASDDPLPSCASLVVDPQRAGAEGSRRVAVTLGRARAGELELRAARELRLDVKGPLTSNHLEELELALPDGPLKLWVRVTQVVPGFDGRVVADAVPFSPTVDQLARLDALAAGPHLEAA